MKLKKSNTKCPTCEKNIILINDSGTKIFCKFCGSERGIND